MVKKGLIKIIRIYQRTFSPDHSQFTKHKYPLGFCKFQPTCSEYAVLSIEKYGIFKGTFKSIYRIIKCNPLNKGGIDLP